MQLPKDSNKAFGRFLAHCVLTEKYIYFTLTWSVKNLNWHFWQLSGGRLWIIFGWILTLCINCMWFRSCSRSLMYPSQISQMTKLSLEPLAAGAPGLRPPPTGPGAPPRCGALAAGDPPRLAPTGVIEILGLFDLKPPVFEMLWNLKIWLLCFVHYKFICFILFPSSKILLFIPNLGFKTSKLTC